MGVSDFFNQMQDMSESLPTIKTLPEKVDGVRYGLYDLRDRVVKEYVTYNQVDETLRKNTNDIYKKVTDSFEAKLGGLVKEMNLRLPNQEAMRKLNAAVGQ